MKGFVSDTLMCLGASSGIDDDTFNHVFNHFDLDNSGAIDKNEMVAFLL